MAISASERPRRAGSLIPSITRGHGSIHRGTRAGSTRARGAQCSSSAKGIRMGMRVPMKGEIEIEVRPVVVPGSTVLASRAAARTKRGRCTEHLPPSRATVTALDH